MILPRTRGKFCLKAVFFFQRSYLLTRVSYERITDFKSSTSSFSLMWKLQIKTSQKQQNVKMANLTPPSPIWPRPTCLTRPSFDPTLPYLFPKLLDEFLRNAAEGSILRMGLGSQGSEVSYLSHNPERCCIFALRHTILRGPTLRSLHLLLPPNWLLVFLKQSFTSFCWPL